MPYSDKELQKKFQREHLRKKRIVVRERAIACLGGKCGHCGIDDIRVLQIDHIKAIQRGSNGIKYCATYQTMLQIIRGELLDQVQLLCANCHMIKTYEERKTYPNYIG